MSRDLCASPIEIRFQRQIRGPFLMRPHVDDDPERFSIVSPKDTPCPVERVARGQFEINAFPPAV